MAMVTKDSRILVVGGGGTMGSSTALELARRGYKDVTVFDMFEPPSANSAGNDMNKMISTQYLQGIWGRLACEAWDTWQSDPLFAPFLHKTGRIDLATSADVPRAEILWQQYKRCRDASRPVEWLDNADDIVRHFPQLDKAKVQGYVGLHVEQAGWMAARDALRAVGVELLRLGVKSAFGSSGTFDSLTLDTQGRCTGVKTADGTVWAADLVIMATGAWTPALIDLEGQCESKCWQFGHLQLAKEEAEELRGCPSRYCSEIGFFMEPSESGLMKFVNEFQGYTHRAECRPYGSSSDQVLSVPRSHAVHPSDGIPDEGRDAIHCVIDTFLPHLSGRQLMDQALCWCTDSVDGNWLLCPHPRFDNVVLDTGDSGHTFKMLPIVGRYVVDLIEGKASEISPVRRPLLTRQLSPADMELWRWRPELVGRAQAREGPRPKDLADVPGWKVDARL